MNEMNLAVPCAEYEHDLVELLDGTLTPEHARIVRLHLAACPRCRAWQREFAALDARLAATLPRPVLSSDFDRNLTERLSGVARRASAADLRAAVDREYTRAIDAIRRGARRRAVLDALGSAAVAGCLAVLADRWLASLGGALSTLDGPTRWIALGVLGSAVAIVALGWTARRGALPLPAAFR